MSLAANYFWSMRYLKPSQIWWRLLRSGKDLAVRIMRSFGIFPGAGARGSIATAGNIPVITSRLHCADIELRKGRYAFLHHEVTLPEGREDARREILRQPLLWQFHFQYHDYLYALLQRSGGDARGEVYRAIREWMDAWPAGAPDARSASWHAYVLSIRIEIWIRILSEFGAGLTAEERDAIQSCLYRQARTLRRNIEWGTLANHLLRNIKAMIFAGRFFDTEESRGWLAWGLRMLARELREQILADGCHFERSPMYHIGILSDLCDLFELLRGSEEITSRVAVFLLEETISAMTAFARHILHPDGEYPFFNDAASSESLYTREALARAEKLAGTPAAQVVEPVRTEEDTRSYSGIHVFRGNRLFAAFDAGNIGPDYQPGHAHADTLSFECSWAGARWISDTGVFHYRQSPERRYARSTAAHNTLRIGGRDQSDVWHSFRVGKRARIVARSVRREEGYALFQAAHDGYRSLVHERALLLLEDRCIVVADWIHGKGNIDAESFLHFHPGVRLEQTEEGAVAQLDGETCRILPLDPEAGVRIGSSEYFPSFGVRCDRSSLLFSLACACPRLTGYMLVFADSPPSFRLDQKDKMLQIQTDTRLHIDLSPLI